MDTCYKTTYFEDIFSNDYDTETPNAKFDAVKDHHADFKVNISWSTRNIISHKEVDGGKVRRYPQQNGNAEFKLVVGIFHVYAQQPTCQIEFNPRYIEGFGLTHGESMGRLWSSLDKFALDFIREDRMQNIERQRHKDLISNPESSVDSVINRTYKYSLELKSYYKLKHEVNEVHPEEMAALETTSRSTAKIAS
ncbi:hypothetical protein VTP01DRAFT_2493 [Rhizomucor pusillus]|uniref:uncharacterized protein n=1 Tax=Rhizomucor pusillus TaxID=4840 RepID=UPI0037435A43